jgi:hypothetical protein
VEYKLPRSWRLLADNVGRGGSAAAAARGEDGGGDGGAGNGGGVVGRGAVAAADGRWRHGAVGRGERGKCRR